MFLIKRKTKGAVKLLTSAIDTPSLKPYYKGIACIYRAYALMTGSAAFESALKDYARAGGFGKALGKSSLFNQLLCRGLLEMQGRRYDVALTRFVEAQKLIPRNREIVFYKSSAMVAGFLQRGNNAKHFLQAIKAEYDAGIRLQKNDHFLHFYRGIISLYCKDFVAALNDFDRSIRNDDEPNAKYHMYRGLAYACLSMFKEAMKDLSTSIRLKDDCLPAYHIRGKCAYLLGDNDLAFMDFQKLIELRPV